MATAGKRIGLLHHMGGGNLGDDGTLDAVLQNIRSRWPDSEIVGLSMNPDDTHKRHGIVSYPIRQRTWNLGNTSVNHGTNIKQRAKAALSKYPSILKLVKALNAVVVGIPTSVFKEMLFLARAIRLIKSLDLLIICGGGQLVESSGGPWEFVGGPWHFPFTIFKWVLGAKLLRVKCVMLNIGAGPLVRTLSKYFVRKAISFADYASFRDPESRGLVHEIGVTRRTHVVCDSAYSLHIPAANGSSVMDSRCKGIVGLAPMAYGDPRLSPKHDPAVYNQFIQQLATFASWLLKNGYSVTLFCTDIGIDPPAIEDLERQLRNDSSISKSIADGSLRRVHQWTTRELLENMSSMDYLVVCRFHAVVFAHLLNLPVLAINHHPKVRAQMIDLGLPEYCVNLEDCNLEVLARTFSSLVSNQDGIRNRMSERLACYKQKLSAQFDELFPPHTYPTAKTVGGLVGTHWPGPCDAH
jgi:polysaccharide pyruvyl transferase WcaK-like protein